MFLTRVALAIAEIPSGDDGRTDRISIWFFDGSVAMETGIAVGRGKPWSIKACAAVAGLAFRLPRLHRTRPSYVALSGSNDSRIFRCLADTSLLGSELA